MLIKHLSNIYPLNLYTHIFIYLPNYTNKFVRFKFLLLTKFYFIRFYIKYTYIYIFIKYYNY